MSQHCSHGLVSTDSGCAAQVLHLEDNTPPTKVAGCPEDGKPGDMVNGTSTSGTYVIREPAQPSTCRVVESFFSTFRNLVSIQDL